MALGGGNFITQNKKLPGSYINFVGTKRSVALSERGTAAVALDMPWGELGKIVTIEKDRVQKNSKTLFGYAYDAPELMPIRELFIEANKLLFYRLGTGGATATNTIATAKYAGIKGNDIITTVSATTDGENQTGWLVTTYFGNDIVRCV